MNSLIPFEFHASTLHYCNQPKTISLPHINGVSSYLYLYSGLNLWLTVSDNSDSQLSRSWSVNKIVQDFERKWFFQRPGELVIIPGSLKHIVFSLIQLSLQSTIYAGGLI